MLTHQHKSAQPVTIIEWDLIFILEPNRTSKFSSESSGPCRVLPRGHGSVFTIRFLDSGSERVVHVDHLKRVHPDFPLPPDLPEPAVSSESEPPVPSRSTSEEYRSKLRSGRSYM